MNQQTIKDGGAKAKERLAGINFTRAVCAIGIIVYHFFCHSNSEFKFVYNTRNGYYGDIIVTTFFILSGIVLQYNYKVVDKSNIRKYYYNRWKAIFPAFYLCYLCTYYRYVITRGCVCFGGKPYKIIMTVLGLDGYFAYAIGFNYYIIGEWFLGAIIMLYVLYPCLSIAITKIGHFFVFLLLIVLYWLAIYSGFVEFEVIPYRNLMTCILSFYLGILIGKRPQILHYKWVFLMASLAFIFLRFVSLNDNYLVTIIQVQGLALVLVLTNIGSWIESYAFFKRVVATISGCSYIMFLLQHVIITDVLSVYNPDVFVKCIIILFVVVFIVIIFSLMAKALVQSIINHPLYKHFEECLMEQSINGRVEIKHSNNIR